MPLFSKSTNAEEKPVVVGRADRRVAEAAAEISMNPEKAIRVFMARELVQCTLPHSDPGNIPAWTRRNGNRALAIKPGSNIDGVTYGYPYGTLPRLLLFWLVTEACRTQSRKIALGTSLYGFMKKLGLNPDNGGKRGDTERFRDQMSRLFRCTIQLEETIFQNGRAYGIDDGDMPITKHRVLLWHPKNAGQIDLFESYVEIGEDFFKVITANPVPYDMRVLKALKSSALGLDIYTWLNYRCFTAGKPSLVPWNSLMGQLGSNYKEVRNFITKVKPVLAKISVIQPNLVYKLSNTGICVYPSRPSISSRSAIEEAPALPRQRAPSRDSRRATIYDNNFLPQRNEMGQGNAMCPICQNTGLFGDESEVPDGDLSTGRVTTLLNDGYNLCRCQIGQTWASLV